MITTLMNIYRNKEKGMGLQAPAAQRQYKGPCNFFYIFL